MALRIEPLIHSVFSLAALVALNLWLIVHLPSRIWEALQGTMLLTLGPIAVWRYGWWLLHLVRSSIYAQIVFPKMRKRARKVWESGWRPSMIHFLMTTYREDPGITRGVLESVLANLRRAKIRARIVIGTGDKFDEDVIEAIIDGVDDVDVEVVFVRQNQGGKRAAMGLVLRAMSRKGVGQDDLVVFMDGDAMLGENVIESCASLFPLYPKLGAVTTDEDAIVRGPAWMQTWCDMRFAQRRLAMQSHSLSKKVLTLTGRLSVFRAPIVVEEKFIRILEADHLDDWLWGRFRFLSGDDKSTWFSMLGDGWEMLYVRDAYVTTIEVIKEKPFLRAQQNLLRWSGNMLRNGSRALALGPNKVGWFIWWCVLDQRISIWTSLSGLAMALVLSVAETWEIMLGYLVWVLVTRSLVSLVLCCYSGRITIGYPFLLYGNQVLTSTI